ncbi:MAG: CDP-diacylglycerol--glycerol-3-phosphate 3-phosphatidyltransferase [Candidatus Zixiibacteriota bacterium]
MIRILPNILTIFRMIAAPIMIYLYLDGSQGKMIAGFVFFILGSLSDSLDGYIARKYEVASRFGRILDPIADKFLVFCAMAVLVIIGEVLWWIAVAIALRDVLVTLLRLLNRKQDNLISPTIFAKFKTSYQMFAITALLFVPIVTDIPGNKISSIPNLVMLLALVFTWVSAIPYFRNSLFPKKQ